MDNSEISQENGKSLAERRQKRDVRERKQLFEQRVYEEPKRPENSYKSHQKGWYRVEAIVGHRIVKVKK